MRPTNFLELVFQSLPDDMRGEELTSIGSPQMWAQEPRQALAQALRLSPRINWQAYMENYPDIREAGIDPVEHFLRDGVFENRKLFSWHPLRWEHSQNVPKVSVVVTASDCEIFLENCLESLLAQTLEEIEIIIVDDASTDGTLDIARNFAKRDKRIKILARRHKRGLHMARKAGVAAASGDFVMFLDGEGFYVSHACETAWRTVAKGYDIAEFNVKIIDHAGLSEEGLKQYAQQYDDLPPGLYKGFQLVTLAYIDQRLSKKLVSKICLRQIVQLAFTEMENGDYPWDPDFYEFLLILHKARNFMKIGDVLCNISLSRTAADSFAGGDDAANPRMRNMLAPMLAYCEANALDMYGDHIRQAIFRDCLSALPNLSPQTANTWFHNLLDMFGPLYTAVNLLRKYYHKWEDVSSKFYYFRYGAAAKMRMAIDANLT